MEERNKNNEPTKKCAQDPSDYVLAELFRQRCFCRKIDGTLCCYNGKFYEELDDKKLQSYILAGLNSELKKIGKAKKIKDIAYLVKLRTELDPDCMPAEKDGWLGFENGLLNIESFNFCPLPVHDIYNTYCIRTTYDYSHAHIFEGKTAYGFLNAEQELKQIYYTPWADQFFAWIAQGDEQLIRRIYEMIGYLIVPDTTARAFFLLQGVPHSGKSVLGRFIEGYFPSSRVTSLDIARLGGQFLPEAMDKSCLNLSMDLADGNLPSKSVAMLKMLTGGDLATREAKYKDAKSYRGQCKFLFSTNHKLKMRELDQAFLERLICIPFNNPVPKEQEDVSLSIRLNEEREGITMKALFYYRRFVENNRQFSGEGLCKPQIEYQLTAEETIKEFVREKCVLVSLNEGATYTKDLYQAYQLFCNENLLKPVGSVSGFAQRLSALYSGQIQPDRWRDGEDNGRGFRGIQIEDTYGYEYDDFNDEYDEKDENNGPKSFGQEIACEDGTTQIVFNV